mmetsp:Transcript_146496/g.365319  ORF Transcript_146496/g.365319 Transcript_146496/m.365319 type:complete len:163 (+) Transcript_146496:324-812(+)
MDAGSPLAVKDGSVKRSSSEYVKSPQQQASKYVKQWEKRQQDSDQVCPKAFFQQAEAQAFAHGLRERIQEAAEEDFEEWNVVEHRGDFVRKAVVKMLVNSGEGEYVHIFALRPSRGEKWKCRFACGKAKEDPLEEQDDDYESLPDPGCGQSVEEACTACSLM